MTLAYARRDVKDRARAEWRGMCNVTLPSFTPLGLETLDESGIRHDVVRAAADGYWGTLIASESGTSLEEYVRFMEIAAGAAPPGFRLVTHLSFDSMDQAVVAADAAAGLGFEAALVSYPPSFRPTSGSDIVQFTRDLSERTDLALILFAVATWGFRSLHPSQFPPEAIAEMAKFDTAAAVKYEANSPGLVAGIADLLRRCGDDVLVQCPMEYHAPGLVDWFGMQWMGTSGYESFGDRPPRWFALLHEGRWDEAMELYWSYQPAREAKGAFHQSFAGANLIHRVGWKYLGWLHGYNGGLLRMPQMRLNPGQMRALRQGVAASGFEVPADDVGFYEGCPVGSERP
ncbi:MAG: dihydrodipicolinate synthase family protein [Acidimicrobiia bacterium]